MSGLEISEERLSEIRRNSFRNFHAKGLDYICLQRSDKLTRKAYFFDGNHRKLPEVVNPHDHRYGFHTHVLSGTMSNRFYTDRELEDVDGAVMFNRFDWDTPLNGGDGFTWREQVPLVETSRTRYQTGSHYLCSAHQIHTIDMHEDQVALLINQYEDVVPVGTPTSTYSLDDVAPDTSGLYDEFSNDQILERLLQLQVMGVSL